MSIACWPVNEPATETTDKTEPGRACLRHGLRQTGFRVRFADHRDVVVAEVGHRRVDVDPADHLAAGQDGEHGRSWMGGAASQRRRPPCCRRAESRRPPRLRPRSPGRVLSW